jgi:hypothetical protein
MKEVRERREKSEKVSSREIHGVREERKREREKERERERESARVTEVRERLSDSRRAASHATEALTDSNDSGVRDVNSRIFRAIAGAYDRKSRSTLRMIR